MVDIRWIWLFLDTVETDPPVTRPVPRPRLDGDSGTWYCHVSPPRNGPMKGFLGVPVTFAIVDGCFVTAVDHKPKTTRALARLDNVRASGTATVPSGREPVRMSWRFTLSPKPVTTSPFSVSELALPSLALALCRSATLVATVTPLALTHGPLPMRSTAATVLR